jgi:hypothetical protein
MTNIIIMVHHPFSEIVLKRLFFEIPEVKVISIPSDTSSKPLILQTEDLRSVLLANRLDYSNIDFFLVESNYGDQSSLEINAKLLDHILNNFQNATIIAYSNTPESLTRAFHHHERINIIDNTISVEIGRIYSYKKLKSEVKKHALTKPSADLQMAVPQMPPPQMPVPQMASRHEGSSSAQRRNSPPILHAFTTNTPPPLAQASPERPKKSEGEAFHHPSQPS